MAEVANPSALTQETIKELGILVPILQTNRTTLEGMGIVIAALVIVNVYLYHALSKRPSRQPARQRPRRRRVLRRQRRSSVLPRFFLSPHELGHQGFWIV